MQAAERALADAGVVVPLDDKRITLAGLSNGSTGVSRLAMEMGDRFRGLIYISGVIKPSIVTSDAFLEGWRERPVLVVHAGPTGASRWLRYARRRRGWKRAVLE